MKNKTKNPEETPENFIITIGHSEAILNHIKIKSFYMAKENIKKSSRQRWHLDEILLHTDRVDIYYMQKTVRKGDKWKMNGKSTKDLANVFKSKCSTNIWKHDQNHW